MWWLLTVSLSWKPGPSWTVRLYGRSAEEAVRSYRCCPFGAADVVHSVVPD